jgi:2-C-methyl-D-erythritol 4-phosphate cytidylyltransferase/2-C-methyl-D-erythritol 2,4-cyclodiphosphate synthase
LSKVFAIILAAGNGSRILSDKPKQFLYHDGDIVLKSVVKKFLNIEKIDFVLCVIPAGYFQDYESIFHDFKNERLLPPIYGGLTRKESVRNGLEAIAKFQPDYVLIHDAARADINKNIIDAVINELHTGEKAVVPGMSPVDSVKVDGRYFDRERVTLIQTPQGFEFQTIYFLHNKYRNLKAKDDAILCELDGINVKLIVGDHNNKKITYASDFKHSEIKIGFGYDVHAFSQYATKKLVLMGVLIDNHIGLDGISDADVGIHSLVDAILGALGEGSIGEHFPSTDIKFKNANSLKFLEYCKYLLLEQGYKIVNCDTIIVCETPKIVEYSTLMKKTISEILQINESAINIKGKTTEGLGFTGRREGIAAYSSVLIKK